MSYNKMVIDLTKVMVAFKTEMADGSYSYAEQDGDVGWNELPGGKWECRSTNWEGTKTFESYGELEAFMMDYLKLDGIIVFK